MEANNPPIGYKQTEIGIIPEEWEVVRLGDVAEKMKAGGTPSTKEKSFWDGNIPFVLIEDITSSGKYLFNTKASITQEGLNNSSSWLVPENSIILSLYGTVGNAIITKIPVAITQNMAGIIPNELKCNRDFLYYALENAKNYLWSIIDISVHKHITVTKAKLIPIPLPPLPEQHRIATVLSTIQRAIEQQDKIIEATKKLKKALMHTLFTEGLNGKEQKETEIGLIPKSWEVVRLGDIGAFQYGYTESALEQDTGIKFLRITDIEENGYIEWSYVPYCKVDQKDFEKYQLKDGDVLITRIGATTGKTCFIYNPPKSVFASYLIRFKPKVNDIETRFVHYYTQTAIYWLQVEANKEGKLKKGLSASVLKNFLIPLPPLPEQHQIAHILSTVDNKIEVEERKKATLKELFKTTLHKLMGGEIRVNKVEI